EEHIAQYRAYHALGAMPRLAIELLIGTGQRRSDIVRMGRAHVRAGILSIRQFKGRRWLGGILIEIPLLPELRGALDAMPKSDPLTFPTHDYVKPFTSDSFGDWFVARCAEAGIPPGLTAHGLRKAAATRLADNGATAHELMSWFGWKSIKEAERYTKSA